MSDFFSQTLAANSPLPKLLCAAILCIFLCRKNSAANPDYTQHSTLENVVEGHVANRESDHFVYVCIVFRGFRFQHIASSASSAYVSAIKVLSITRSIYIFSFVCLFVVERCSWILFSIDIVSSSRFFDGIFFRERFSCTESLPFFIDSLLLVHRVEERGSWLSSVESNNLWLDLQADFFLLLRFVGSFVAFHSAGRWFTIMQVFLSQADQTRCKWYFRTQPKRVKWPSAR